MSVSAEQLVDFINKVSVRVKNKKYCSNSDSQSAFISVEHENLKRVTERRNNLVVSFLTEATETLNHIYMKEFILICLACFIFIHYLLKVPFCEKCFS